MAVEAAVFPYHTTSVTHCKLGVKQSLHKATKNQYESVEKAARERSVEQLMQGQGYTLLVPVLGKRVEQCNIAYVLQHSLKGTLRSNHAKMFFFSSVKS